MPTNSRNVLYSHLALGNEHGHIYEGGNFNMNALSRTMAAARVMAGNGDAFARSFLTMLEGVQTQVLDGNRAAAYEALAPLLSVARETVTSTLPDAAAGPDLRPPVRIGGPNGERC